jgi:hypothetical protein
LRLTNLRSRRGRASPDDLAGRARGGGGRTRIATIMTFPQVCPDNANQADAEKQDLPRA